MSATSGSISEIFIMGSSSLYPVPGWCSPASIGACRAPDPGSNPGPGAIRSLKVRFISKRKYAITIKESKLLIDRALKEIPGLNNVITRRKVSLQVLEVPWKGKTAKVYYYDNYPLLVELPTGDLIPFLTSVEKFNLPLPRVVVDLGAVKPIANGAHVMGPGIREVKGEFSEGDLVVVVDEKLGAALAIGRALRPSIEAKEKGRTIYNLHHAGDSIWRAVASEEGR